MSKVILNSLSNLAGAGSLKISPGTKIDISDQSHILIPQGNTDDRPEDSKSGQIRYNTDLKTLEYWDSVKGDWIVLKAKEDYEQIVQEGLVLHIDASSPKCYTVDGGDVVFDLTRYTHDGLKINGGPDFVENPIPAFDFNGATGATTAHQLRSKVVPALTEQYTYIIWFKFDQGTRTAGSGRKDILYGIDYARPHLTFDREGDGKWGNYLTKAGSGNDTVKSTTSTWNNNQWYMIATTGNPTRDRIYVDGVLETEVALSGSYTSWSTFNFSLASAQSFPGQIAAAQFYARELTPGEIWHNYTVMAPRFGVAESALGASEVTSGRVHHYDASDPTSYPGTGNTWYDIAGSNNLTKQNSATFSREVGGCWSFSGGGYFESVSNLSLSDYTFSVWCKPKYSRPPSTNAVMAWGESFATDKAGMVLRQLSDGRFNFWYEAADDADYNIYTPLVYRDTWINLIVEFQGSNNLQRIFLNGVATGNVSNAQPPDTSINQDFVVGCRNNSPSAYQDFFNGEVAKVEIWNRCLTSGEARQTFKANRRRFGI